MNQKTKQIIWFSITFWCYLCHFDTKITNDKERVELIWPNEVKLRRPTNLYRKINTTKKPQLNFKERKNEKLHENGRNQWKMREIKRTKAKY